MPNDPEKAIFSNDAVITILKTSDGVAEYPTPRPASGEALKRAQEFVKKREESRRLMEEKKKAKAEANPEATDPK